MYLFPFWGPWGMTEDNNEWEGLIQHELVVLKIRGISNSFENY